MSSSGAAVRRASVCAAWGAVSLHRRASSHQPDKLLSNANRVSRTRIAPVGCITTSAEVIADDMRLSTTTSQNSGMRGCQSRRSAETGFVMRAYCAAPHRTQRL
jgi:hypothetical protein